MDTVATYTAAWGVVPLVLFFAWRQRFAALTIANASRSSGSEPTEDDKALLSNHHHNVSRAAPTGVPASNTRRPSTKVVYRIRGSFDHSDLPRLLEECFKTDCKPNIHSFAPQADTSDNVATVTFDNDAAFLHPDEVTFEAQKVTIDRHFRGLTVLFSPEESKHDVDIIAVCGLGGHAFGSFKERNGQHMWLRDDLKNDFPNARILTYGYDSQIPGSVSFQTLRDIGGSLAMLVEGMTPLSSSHPIKPIIFISHSLGGLVLKEALIRSGRAARRDTAASSLFHRTRGVLFFGVPHLGMNIGSLLPMAENQPNQAFLQKLAQGSELLLKQYREFREFSPSNTEVFCFHETKLSPIAQQHGKEWKMNGPKEILVGEHSATACGRSEEAPESRQGLNRDHSDLVKFRAKDDDYLKVRHILEKMIMGKGSPLRRIPVLTPEERNLIDRCLQAVFRTDPRVDMQRLEATKDTLLKGCHHWIMQDRQLLDWRTMSDRRLLWIRGGPGKGKTMLMISLVQELQSRKDSHALTFFFCQSASKELNTATAVLRGLLWTLLHENPSFGRCLLKDYKHIGDQFCKDDSSAFYTVRKILLELLQDKDLPPIYLLIDALDECDVERKLLLEFIQTNLANNNSKAKWLVSSRYSLDLERSLGRDHNQTLSLELNAAHIDQAVRIYIDHKTKRLAENHRYDASLEAEVNKHLLENAQSTFLWVALVCKSLEETQAYRVRSILHNFPLGLEPLYDRMLRQLGDREHTAAILKCITLANRPILIEELASLAGLPPDVFGNEQALVHLIKMCGSFLIVHDRTRSVYFVHQSAKDYFVSGNGRVIFGTGTASEHSQLAKRCLDLLTRSLKTNICSLKHPGAPPCSHPALLGLEYACCSWVGHLKNAVADGHQRAFERVEGIVFKFLSEHLLHWLEALAHLNCLHVGITALKSLETLINGNTGSTLFLLVHDAVRVILQCRLAVEQAPLQIYNSGLLFAPSGSSVRRRFLRQISWIETPPAVGQCWTPLLQTFEGHESGVSSVAFAPDGHFLATGDYYNGTVRLWDPDTGKLLQTLNAHNGGRVSAALARGGLLVSGSEEDDTVRIWEAGTARQPRELKGPEKGVRSLALTPDGRILAVCQYYVVWLWDLVTDKLLRTFESHEESVALIALSPDGHRVASCGIGSKDGKVRVWKVKTGELLQTLEARAIKPISIIFSPDGQQLATGGKSGIVRLWNTDTGTQVGTFSGGEKNGSYKPVNSVAFSPNGRLLASGDGANGTVLIWDTVTGRELRKIEVSKHGVSSLAFSPDGHHLATAHHGNGLVQLLDTSARTSPILGHNERVASLVFAPDGRQLASRGFGDKNLHLWDVSTGTLLRTLACKENGSLVSFSQDGRHLASSGDEYHDEVVLWNTDSWERSDIHHDSNKKTRQRGIKALAFAPGGDLLASGGMSKTVCVWNVDTEERRDFEFGGKITSLAFAPHGYCLALNGHSGCVDVLDSRTGLPVWRSKSHDCMVSSVAFAPDGHRLASGDVRGAVRIFDTGPGEFWQTPKVYEHPENAEPDTLRLLKTFKADRAPGRKKKMITSVEFAPDGHKLASRDMSGTMRLWDLDTGNLVQKLEGHENGIRLAFAPDASEEASWMKLQLSSDQDWILWDGKKVLWIPPSFRPHSYTIRGRRIAIGTSSGNVYVLGFNHYADDFLLLPLS